MSGNRDDAGAGSFRARLGLLAVGFVAGLGPRVDDAVRLAENLVASGDEGSATLGVATLSRDALWRDAEGPIRSMLSEQGIEVPDPHDEDELFKLLLVVFGFWELPLYHFEGPFYVQVPGVEQQTRLDRELLRLLDERDHEADPGVREGLVSRMRQAVQETLDPVLETKSTNRERT